MYKKIDTESKTKIAVYTVIMGDGYTLPEVQLEDGADFLCFTDQVEIQPNGWTIIQCKPLIPTDLPRSSREQKLRAHRWLHEYVKSIYIDPSVKITSSVFEIWNYLIPNENVVFGCLRHSFRHSLADEFTSIKHHKLDHEFRVNELLDEIRSTKPFLLSKQPLWGGFIARRHMSPLCIDAMERWFAYVMRYSRRDQLSLPLVLLDFPSDYLKIRTDDIYKSKYHTWPIEGYKRPQRYHNGYRRKKIFKSARQKVRQLMGIRRSK